MPMSYHWKNAFGIRCKTQLPDFDRNDAILASHPMAAPLKPRTSTLRVRTIRWKCVLSDLLMYETHKKLREDGAILTLSGNFGGSSIKQGEPFIVRTITHVTWPEARK